MAYHKMGMTIIQLQTPVRLLVFLDYLRPGLKLLSRAAEVSVNVGLMQKDGAYMSGIHSMVNLKLIVQVTVSILGR